MKFGIVGCGTIAARFAQALNQSDNGEFYACASRSAEKAEKFCTEHMGRVSYGSYEELAQDPDVEVVYIALPHTEHFDKSAYFLKAWKNVICEKPVTMNADQAEELTRISKENNVFFMEAMWTKVLPATIKTHEIISSGAIGEVKRVEASFAFLTPYDPTHRLYNKALGGGALLDVGIYPVSYICDLCGVNPKQISAVSVMNKDGIDETTAVTMEFDGGVIASGFCSIAVRTSHDANIYGTKGSIVAEKFFRSVKLTVTVEGKEPEIYTFPENRDLFIYEIEEAVCCIRAGKTMSDKIPHEFSVGVMRVMDEIRRQVKLEY